MEKQDRLYAENEKYIHQCAEANARSIRRKIGIELSCDIHDWMQDIELAIYKALKRYDEGRAGIRTYISIVAVSKARSIASRETRRREHGTHDTQAAASILDTRHSDGQLARRIWRTIHEMKDEDAKRICTEYFSGTSISKIASCLKMSRKAVKNRIREEMDRLASEEGINDVAKSSGKAKGTTEKLKGS